MPNQLTLTRSGQQAVANALLVGIPLQASFIAVGSADGDELNNDSAQLGAELIRLPLDKQTRSGSQVTFEAVLSETMGPFTLNEMGIYDNTDTLIAYGSLPGIYKPAIVDDYGVAVRIKATLAFSTNPAGATLIIGASDNNIFYTPNKTRVRLVINDDLTITPTPF